MFFNIPTQNTYNDIYQQRITDYGTVYREKYLSRASNLILKAIGDNVVVSGLLLSASYVGTNVTLAFSPGSVVHDSTLISIDTTTTLTADVAAVSDTLAGSYLAVFTDFQYIEAPDSNSQTALRLSVYHVNASGVPTAFSGSPSFTATRNQLLVSKIRFVKAGGVVTELSEVPWTLTNESAPSLVVSGTTYYMRGYSPAVMNSYDYLKKLYDQFLDEFHFHDMIS